MLVALLSRRGALRRVSWHRQAPPCSAETWISNRASLLASWCGPISLVLAHPLVWPWQLALHFFVVVVIWSFGGSETSLNVCCVVHAWQKESLFVCLSWTPYAYCVCVCVCRWAAGSRLSLCRAVTPRCCRKQRGDLGEKVFFFCHQWQSQSLYKFLCGSSLLGAPLRKEISSHVAPESAAFSAF